MRYGILAVAVATAFGIAAGPSYAQADAKAVIEKVITAHGGKELLEKYPASRNKFKGELSILGMDIAFENNTGRHECHRSRRERRRRVGDVAGDLLLRI